MRKKHFVHKHENMFHVFVFFFMKIAKGCASSSCERYSILLIFIFKLFVYLVLFDHCNGRALMSVDAHTNWSLFILFKDFFK